MRLKAFGVALCASLAIAGAAIAQMAPFHWLEDSTVSITTGNVSANVALLRMPSGVTQIRVYTACTTTIFIRKGTSSSATAAATDMPIAPGSVEVLTLNNTISSPVTHMAMISPSGSCTVYLTTGEGI